MTDARWADRISGAVVAGLTRRALAVDGGEVVEVDGLIIGFTNLPDPSINGAAVADEPSDPDRALAVAEDEFRRRGHPFFGIELERGRYPSVEDAIERAGLALLFSHPALASLHSDLGPPIPPDEVEITRVLDDDDLVELRSLDLEAFGGDPAVTERFLGPGMIANPDNRSFLARTRDAVVGSGAAWLLEGTVGIFGIGVAETARRRGVGAALTLTAAHAFGEAADLAWLHPSEMARSMYEALGFRRIADWDVWTRPQPGD